MEMFFRNLMMIGCLGLGIIFGFCICGDTKLVLYAIDKVVKEVATTMLEIFTGRDYR